MTLTGGFTIKVEELLASKRQRKQKAKVNEVTKRHLIVTLVDRSEPNGKMTEQRWKTVHDGRPDSVANGRPYGSPVGSSQTGGDGQGINPIHTEGEGTIPHHNPRPGAEAATATKPQRTPCRQVRWKRTWVIIDAAQEMTLDESAKEEDGDLTVIVNPSKVEHGTHDSQSAAAQLT
ncbi:hypothetical protein KR038_002249 [Drosophila bunnanda]|nr:hypothetical protein KR038_002249 [Drosophila bunnanda]